MSVVVPVPAKARCGLRARQWLAGHRRTLAAAAIVLVIPFLLSGLHIATYEKLSPIDEWAHLDSAFQTSHGHIVRRGDALDVATTRVIGCRSIDSPGFVSPYSCEGDPTATIETNTAYMHPPLYYAITGLAARLSTSVGVTGSFLTGARIVNAVWLAAGTLLTFLMLGELHASRLVRASCSLLPLLAPMVLFQGSTVTNDVTAIPSAAAALWLTFRYDNRTTHAWALAAVAIASVWLRTTNVFGIALCALYLLIRALHDPPRRRRLLQGALVLIASAGIAAAVWLVVIDQMALVPAAAFRLRPLFPQRLTWHDLIVSVAPMVPPTGALPDVTMWSGRDLVQLQVAALGWLLVSAPFMAMLEPSPDSDQRWSRTTAETAPGEERTLQDTGMTRGIAIGIATAVVAILTGPALVIINAVSSDSYLGSPPPARLAMSVVPGFVVCVAFGARRRNAARALALFVAAGLISTAAVLL